MFKIGDFSRLARVSIKTLRHYDDEGLLAPACIDAQTGYRYYQASQLETLQRILLLKELGFSLAEIRSLNASADPATLHERLRERRQELERDIARDLARLRYIDALASQSPAHTITLSRVPACVVYSVRATVPHLGIPVEEMFEAAERAVARGSERGDASPFLIFHDEEHRERDLDVEVCIPLRDQARSALASRVIPEVHAACATYRGSYEQTWPIYADMLRWLDTARCEMAGPLREVYHRYGARQSGYRLPDQVLTSQTEEYVTELVVPVGEST